MKRLFQFLFLLCVAAPSYAGSVITATVIVTNTPADGNTITINSDARTFKTTVATPSSQILIGASIGANATNIFNQFAGNKFTTLTLNRSGTNGITLRGITAQAITVSIVGTWGYYTLSTNTTTNAVPIMTPASSYSSQPLATNDYTQLVSDIQDYSTRELDAGTVLLNNIVQTSGDQSIEGAKAFDGANTFTNTVGMAFASTNGLYFKDNSAGTNLYYKIHGDDFGWPTIYNYGGLSGSSLPDQEGGILTYGIVNANFPRLLGSGVTNHYVSKQEFNQITANSGTLTNLVSYTGTNDTITVTNGLNYANGSVMQTVSSLANGSNAAVPTTGYDWIKLTAGPTLPFTINGMAGGGYRNLWVYNATGQDMTIANQSGTDPVATNRIVTMTGADVTTTAAGAAFFKYDTTAQRWICLLVTP
jgi:hypothetical protein